MFLKLKVRAFAFTIYHFQEVTPQGQYSSELVKGTIQLGCMKKVKARLIVRKGNENIALKAQDIALFYRDNTVIIAVDKEEKEYLCENTTLTTLENELDEEEFFRATRKYLINIQYVKGFRNYEKVKLEIFLHLNSPKHHIIISQENAPRFKRWLSDPE